MGEAKRNREELRLRMLTELGRLMEPTSPAEDALNDEIRSLAFYPANRVSSDQLAYMRMVPQQCHQNASVYARLDPSGQSRHVSGWWKRGGIFYFHSVVLVAGKLFCVTPSRANGPLQFAPDFDINWIETEGADGVVMNALRRGEEVPYLVRDFPERVIAEASAAHSALLAGADPRTVRMPQ